MKSSTPAVSPIHTPSKVASVAQQPQPTKLHAGNLAHATQQLQENTPGERGMLTTGTARPPPEIRVLVNGDESGLEPLLEDGVTHGDHRTDDHVPSDTDAGKPENTAESGIHRDMSENQSRLGTNPEQENSQTVNSMQVEVGSTLHTDSTAEKSEVWTTTRESIPNDSISTDTAAESNQRENKVRDSVGWIPCKRFVM